MADYTLYVLDESALTISGGQLDGITQGDGSHLVGATITLNAASWHPVSITDADTKFGDNDGNQRLNGAQQIDGVTYPGGTRVEAEYGLTLSDGTSTWQVVGFNVTNSVLPFATVEGLAFIGGPGGFPPVGVPLKVISAQEGPSYAVADYATPICFAAGTLILTPRGEVAVQDLRPGDSVVTRDSGAQVVRWVGQRTLAATGRMAPVEFAAGALSNARTLRVSPQHRMLVSGGRAELLFGTPEVLVPAIHLVNDSTIRQREGGEVTYVHLLFDAHEIVFAEGTPAESFYPGAVALGTLDAAARDELFEIFPELADGFGPLARPSLRAHEAALLISAPPKPRATHVIPATLH